MSTADAAMPNVFLNSFTSFLRHRHRRDRGALFVTRARCQARPE
jgi:hypothetical protein